MLELKNISVRYDQPVLNELSLTANKGSIYGIVGLNGSGKTTLMNAITQRIVLHSGQVLFNGQPLRAADIGYLETENFFYPRITAREYVAIFMLANPAFDLEAWNALLQLPLDALVDDFSTGMKKKTALLGLLCHNRPVLLLDEPFNGLDLETAEVLKIIVEQLRQQGKTIVLTSHILETLTSTCSAIGHLTNGHIEKTWLKADFATIETDLFASARQQKSALVQRLLKPKE